MRWLVLALVLAAPGASLAAAQRPDPAGKPAAPIAKGEASIAGRVIDRTTRAPIQTAIVQLLSPDRGKALATTTDDSGRYEFSFIAAGEYRVVVSHPDYVSREWGMQDGQTAILTLRKEGLIHLEADVPQRSVDVQLIRGATLSGRVIGREGQPLQDANIRAINTISNLTGPSPPPTFSARSNQRGEYRFTNLPEGEYLLSAFWSGASKSALGSSGSSVFYPGTTDAKERLPVHVAAGATLSDVDVVFPATELLRVSGLVLSGSAAREVEAFLISERHSYRTTVDREGKFSFSGIRSARYALGATAQTDDGLEAISMPIDLTSDISDLTLVLAPATTISGRVVTDDGSPVSKEMQVAAVLAHDGKELDIYRKDRAEMGPGGEFEIRNLYGERVLRMVGVTAGWKIARVTNGKEDVTSLPLEQGRSIEGLLIVITLRD